MSLYGSLISCFRLVKLWPMEIVWDIDKVSLCKYTFMFYLIKSIQQLGAKLLRYFSNTRSGRVIKTLIYGFDPYITFYRWCKCSMLVRVRIHHIHWDLTFILNFTFKSKLIKSVLQHLKLLHLIFKQYAKQIDIKTDSYDDYNQNEIFFIFIHSCKI